MNVAVSLLVYSLAALVIAPPLLARLTHSGQAPRLGVAAWLTAIGSVLVIWLVAGMLAVGEVARHWRYPAILVASCLAELRVAMTGYEGVVAHVLLAAIATTVTLAVAWTSVRMARSLIRMRARAHTHANAVRLVGHRTDAPDVVIVDALAPAAYCVSGRPPAIVLSSAARAALDERELAAVLAHERAHLAGRHATVVAVLRSLAAVFPKTPLISQAPAEVARLLEMCADDAAARRHGRGSLLSGLTTLFGVPPAEGLAVADVAVLARAERLAAPPLPSAAARTRVALVGAVIALVAGPVLVTLLAGSGVWACCFDPVRKGDRSMMMWYGGNWGWGGWALMAVGMAVFWALLITAIVLAVRYLASPRGTGVNSPMTPRTADEVLAHRYARGEIDDDEYQRRLALLRQNR